VGVGTAPKSNNIMAGAPQRKVACMTELLCARPPRLSEQARDGGQACPESPETVYGGGKDGKSPLGCGLEKRPPCPRGTGQKGMPRSSERGVSLLEREKPDMP
jgi:hypothetical protein